MQLKEIIMTRLTKAKIEHAVNSAKQLYIKQHEIKELVALLQLRATELYRYCYSECSGHYYATAELDAEEILKEIKSFNKKYPGLLYANIPTINTISIGYFDLPIDPEYRLDTQNLLRLAQDRPEMPCRRSVYNVSIPLDEGTFEIQDWQALSDFRKTEKFTNSDEFIRFRHTVSKFFGHVKKMRRYIDQVRTSLSQYRTVKQLLVAWPEAEELLPKPEKKETKNLPAVPVAILNAQLGLPTDQGNS